MLSSAVKQSIDECILCWLATVGEDGSPNCSPKEIFTYFNDEIIIANIASPQSVSNILANNNVCLSFVHVFKQKGYKLKGHAAYVDAKEVSCHKQLAILQSLAGDLFVIRGVISIKISSFSEIIAPGYFVKPSVTEQIQIESAKKAYGC